MKPYEILLYFGLIVFYRTLWESIHDVNVIKSGIKPPAIFYRKKWHFWSMLDTIYINAIFAGLFSIVAIGYFEWLLYLQLWIFGMVVYWITHDIIIAIGLDKGPFYIGTTGFDENMRKVFLYEKNKGVLYFVFKLLILFFSGAFLYFYITLIL